MSNKAIRAAMEGRLKTLEPDFPTAWNNVNFNPPNGAFQVPDLLFAEPDDAGYKDSPYIQRGIFWIRVYYPTNFGPGNAEARAELIRNWFARGLSIPTVLSFDVIIDRTPEVTGGEVIEGRFMIAIKIRFWAQVPPGVRFAEIPTADPEQQEW